MDELKPCPFCGYKAEIRRTALTSQSRPKFFVACGVCGVETPRIARTKEEAVTAWNRRTAPENKPLKLEHLRQMAGEPVYLVYPNVPEMDGWQILKGIDQEPDEDGDIGAYFTDDVWESLEGYGNDLLAYARKPEGRV
ncbi:Lar family restriction alleviation protein [Clostridium sp. KNHs216]|uniref:Lar family restriction alleviation protein n=1 Tax=Clostridium sp. KNHs216 TaxID=1550235 RepID=UPI001152C549|nr:Lar family restriction alleviation protein [Clostridium sp. KNHs216]TQI66248.1 Lar family restriction alleviation protein [Clostridium sp. KNHs216]